MAPLIVLPLHVWDRELDSRIIIATILASKGYNVILGHEYNIAGLYTSAENIFYYGAGRPMFHAERTLIWYKNIIQRGGSVFMTHEEGINDLNLVAADAYRGINAQSVEFLTQNISWCAKEASLLIEATPGSLKSQMNKKVAVASHPRIELNSNLLGKRYFQRRSDSISNLFGQKYVLISDNFGVDQFGSIDKISHDYSKLNFDKDKFIKRESSGRLKIGLENMKKKAAAAEEYYIKHSRSRASFVGIVNQIVSKHPDILFVLRPHPLVDPFFWHKHSITVKNLIVLNRDSVEPWLFASFAVIHSGCTVGLQAELANIPAINISDLIDDQRDLGVSSQCSTYNPSSLDDLSSNLASILKESSFSSAASPTSKITSINEYLSFNFETMNHKVFDTLNSCPINIGLPKISGLMHVVNECIGRYQGNAHNFSEDAASSFVPFLGRSLPLFSKSRFFNLQDITKRVNDAIFALGISSKISVVTLAPNIFYISQKSK